MKVVELFAGIGSQRKALDRLEINHEIVNIAEWYIPAILAYDSIHNGKRDIENISVSIEEIKEYLKRYTFSMDSKRPIKKNQIDKYSHNLLRHLYIANIRTNNLVSIDKVHPYEIPNDIDLLTYSFPCQDLSNIGALHGYKKGIDRGANTRSGLLWEVERILENKHLNGDNLPNFLLMENVSALLSRRHKNNFDEWRRALTNMGYENIYWELDASKFGIPQHRNRVFMISFKTDHLNNTAIEIVKAIFYDVDNMNNPNYNLDDFLKTDYTKDIYLREALEAQPNDTPSRKTIYNNNKLLFSNNNGGIRRVSNFCATITTKQDRHPNSGVIDFITERNNYRFITAREAFLLMGFDELDYDAVQRDNFLRNKSQLFFSRDKFYTLAGNSIVVNVLEAIFERINEVYNLYYIEGDED